MRRTPTLGKCRTSESDTVSNPIRAFSTRLAYSLTSGVRRAGVSTRATPPRTSPAKRISEAKATNEILATRRPTRLGGRTGISSSCTDRTEGSDGRRVISLYGNISHANIAIFARLSHLPIAEDTRTENPFMPGRTPRVFRHRTVFPFRNRLRAEAGNGFMEAAYIPTKKYHDTGRKPKQLPHRSDSQSRRPTQSPPGISPRNARPDRLPVNVVRALRGSESAARAGRSG